MNWFFIALIAPLLFASTNHIDKYLISRYLRDGEVGSLVIFSSLFSVFALPVILFFDPGVLNLAPSQIVLLGLNGMLAVISILLYYYALQKDEPSFVVPFYQTIPIFAFILGYFFLGETIPIQQQLASLVIVAGALVLSFELGGKKLIFKKKVVVLMLGASFLYALNSVIFKAFAIHAGFWPVLFWGLVGKIFLGICFFLSVAQYRRQFLSMLRGNNFSVLGIISFNEILYILAEAVLEYATLLAPIALVLLVNAFQPFFVLLMGVAIAIFFPKLTSESLDRKSMTQKILGISLIVAGTYFVGV